ncbi:MAG: Membrane-bound lytic murein transglycosylase F [Syntrophus sp. SKADARSKE-3]|nr:Membrane-bound lytic murein transglycosylase F [Syntrophus sp. SKADARSKE-3]
MLSKDFYRKVVVVLCTILCTFCLVVEGTAIAGDLRDIKKNGVIRHLGIPYANFVTGSGDGLDVELIKLFAKHLGVKYEFVKTDWPEIFIDLTGKTIKQTHNKSDVPECVPIKGDIAAAGITVNSSRQKIVNFSIPTFPNQVWLVARADSSIKPIKPTGKIEKDICAVKALLHGRTLIGELNTSLDPSLYDLDKTGAKISLVSGNINDIAPIIINGNGELTILDMPDALVALQRWPGKIKIIGPISNNQVMATAFSKDSPILLSEFNKFMKKIKRDGTYLRLVKKYYPFATNYSPEFFKTKKE